VRVFCDEPRWIFFEKSFIVFLNSPCYEAPNNAIKKWMGKKNEVSNYFFFGAAANVRHFHHFFHGPPCLAGGGGQSHLVQGALKEGGKKATYLPTFS
jgi:hypothetical protein